MQKISDTLKQQLPGSEYEVVRVTMDDQERILVFLFANYFPYEPLSLATGPEYKMTENDINITLKYLSSGLSLMAMDGDHIIGIAINGEITSDEGDIRAKQAAECAMEEYASFWTLWEQVERRACFWHNDGPHKALFIDALCVDPDYQRRGIARNLIEHSRNLAQESGYKLLRMDCTSFYAARLAEKAGMTCVCTIPFSDYKNEDGEQICNTPHPHTEIKIFKQILLD